ncbi:MAG TPA: F0F1 ATP synthase subunit epsilon [Mesorhizobium sp.]|jgi:F-type H+-transporting ATPase subunit epsilon|nr:F0F1 ATP synthase subunit epsilon [Mesorhizobium sp.]
MADTFPFELVSPERLLFSAQAEAVVIPGTEGEMTVMAHHAPLMTTLKPGIVRVRASAGAEERFLVFGGFADITPAGCTLLAESALSAAEITRDELSRRIEAARADAENARDDDERTRLEQFLSHLSHLEDAV